ncbi:MAG: hypothetical protein RMJ15_02650 [Nitrososphaerota archaeon]|nr:hypothetical protein [Nitrososphaerota archaeon]
MHMLSRRECLIMSAKDKDLDEVIREVTTFLSKANIPEGYTVKVYKDTAACCAPIPVGIIVEIEGPKEQTVRELDLKVHAEIAEICGRMGIEYPEHKQFNIV